MVKKNQQWELKQDVLTEMPKLRQTKPNLALFIVVECMCLIRILENYLVKPTEKAVGDVISQNIHSL